MEKDRAAYLWAVKALGRRMRSASEMAAALTRKGFPATAAVQALAVLREKGWLDDARFAAELVRSRSTHRGHGRIRIRAELVSRGVDAEAADRALADFYPPEAEEETAVRALEKKSRILGTKGDKAALYRFLHRRGFTPAAIAAALDMLMSRRKERR